MSPISSRAMYRELQELSSSSSETSETRRRWLSCFQRHDLEAAESESEESDEKLQAQKPFGV